MAKASPGVLKLPGRFQFLGIPPKGELSRRTGNFAEDTTSFQFLGIPPKGELVFIAGQRRTTVKRFPISRDPPEGGTGMFWKNTGKISRFPISRDPPEGGTLCGNATSTVQ